MAKTKSKWFKYAGLVLIGTFAYQCSIIFHPGLEVHPIDCTIYGIYVDGNRKVFALRYFIAVEPGYHEFKVYTNEGVAEETLLVPKERESYLWVSGGGHGPPKIYITD